MFRATRGQLLPIVGLAFPIFVAFLGLAIDGGIFFSRHQSVRAAADLAAINGTYCRTYPTKPVCVEAASFPGAGASPQVGMALATAKANGWTHGVGGVTVTVTQPTSPDRLKVAITGPYDTHLVRVIGINTLNLQVAGTAQSVVQPAPVAIHTLNPTECGSLTVSGNSTLETNGGIMVNSSCNPALNRSGDSIVKGSSIKVTGGYSSSGPGYYQPSPPQTGVPPIPDPFAGVPIPPASPPNNDDLTCSGSTVLNITPGTYKSIQASGDCTINFAAGMYILRGGGMQVSGNASLIGTGVTFYNTSDLFPGAGGSYGQISLSGLGVLNLTAPSTGPYAGILFFQDRLNEAGMNISGNGMITGLHGAIYGKKLTLTVSGNGTLGSQIVVDKLTVSGNSNINVNYPGSGASGPPRMTLVE